VTRILTGIVLLAWALAVSTAARADLSSLLSALDLGGYSPGERPPDFVGRTTHGSGVSLAALRGKVVILTFWATWCPPCRPELAMLEGLQRELGAQELVVVAVNAREPSPLVREYVETLGLTYAVLVDPRGEIQHAYGVIGLPTTFVIARDGRAVARAIGPRDWAGARSRELLLALLREPASPATLSGCRPSTRPPGGAR
jgi:peroxiredoxin